MRGGNHLFHGHLDTQLGSDMRIYFQVLAAVVIAGLASSCSKPDSNYEALARRKVQCPAGSELQYQPWGKSGMQAICILRNGPVVMAEHGRIQIEGQNALGKQIGEWRWFDEGGKVARTEQYAPKP